MSEDLKASREIYAGNDSFFPFKTKSKTKSMILTNEKKNLNVCLPLVM